MDRLGDTKGKEDKKLFFFSNGAFLRFASVDWGWGQGREVPFAIWKKSAHTMHLAELEIMYIN